MFNNEQSPPLSLGDVEKISFSFLQQIHHFINSQSKPSNGTFFVNPMLQNISIEQLVNLFSFQGFQFSAIPPFLISFL